MVQSSATTVAAYLAELDPDRRVVLEPVLACIRKHIQPGFDEVMNWGMITWEVPLAVFPKTYNKKPLMYCGLAAQKRHIGIYLMCAYSGDQYREMLEDGYQQASIKLDMGKSCIRLRELDGVHLPTIGRVVGACSVAEWIALYQQARG